MKEKFVDSARTPVSSGEQKAKIDKVAEVLDRVINGSSYPYFQETPGDTDESNGEKTMRVLAEARDRSAKGELPEAGESVFEVPVMGTLQTRNSLQGREYDSSVAIDGLYDGLSVLAGRSHRGYYDIRTDSRRLAGSGATSPVDINDSNTVNPQGHSAIVNEEGTPDGVRLDLGSGVSADFRLVNIDNPEAMEMGLVSINIAPISEQPTQMSN